MGRGMLVGPMVTGGGGEPSQRNKKGGERPKCKGGRPAENPRTRADAESEDGPSQLRPVSAHICRAGQHDGVRAQVGGQARIHTPLCRVRPMATGHSEHTSLGTLVIPGPSVLQTDKDFTADACMHTLRPGPFEHTLAQGALRATARVIHLARALG